MPPPAAHVEKQLWGWEAATQLAPRTAGKDQDSRGETLRSRELCERAPSLCSAWPGPWAAALPEEPKTLHIKGLLSRKTADTGRSGKERA